MATEALLGFDLRTPRDTISPWESARRQRYLLDLSAQIPLSVDHWVWPSLSVPPTLSPARDALPRAAGDVIAVTAWLDARRPASAAWHASWYPTKPAVPQRSWHRLGYDVADGSLLSGLSNCGWLPEVEDVARARAEWAPRLSRHHLFDDPEDAAAFAQHSDGRVREHAPFHVVGLYLLPALQR